MARALHVVAGGDADPLRRAGGTGGRDATRWVELGASRAVAGSPRSVRVVHRGPRGHAGGGPWSAASGPGRAHRTCGDPHRGRANTASWAVARTTDVGDLGRVRTAHRGSRVATSRRSASTAGRRRRTGSPEV
ncbi:hypothetical protein FTX61_21090 [Nitriliruptoraceae bacterium ZYF776]|nr:hypothetical protein [Profundirhabdus halotolerans]